MLCDTPSHYLADVPCTEFITSIPTVFEQTHIIAGQIGEYIVTTREKDGKWYVGALTNWDEREVIINLSFLEKENSTLLSYWQMLLIHLLNLRNIKSLLLM